MIKDDLMKKGVSSKMASKYEKMFWKIWEPFDEMTPTEKGYTLANKGVKITNVEAFAVFLS